MKTYFFRAKKTETPYKDWRLKSIDVFFVELKLLTSNEKMTISFSLSCHCQWRSIILNRSRFGRKKTTTTTTIMWMKIITNKNDMIDSMECIQKKNENETWKECIFIYLLFVGHLAYMDGLDIDDNFGLVFGRHFYYRSMKKYITTIYTICFEYVPLFLFDVFSLSSSSSSSFCQ